MIPAFLLENLTKAVYKCIEREKEGKRERKRESTVYN